jgi:hypothetical protein
MQKVHSGVVVHSEGNMVRIEGIDLKVWQKIAITSIYTPLKWIFYHSFTSRNAIQNLWR